MSVAPLATPAAAPQGAPMLATDLDLAEVGGTWRVSCRVDDVPLWFSSADAPLAANWEAVGSALVLAAALQGRRLVLDGHVDGRWLDNVALLLRTTRRWWGTPVLVPEARSVADPPRPLGPTWRDRRRRPVGQAFSGGVDSMHTALARRPAPEVLVLARGFDVALDDEVRGDDVERRVRAIAGALGRQLVVVRTNLRTHPSFLAPCWTRTHGGATAALGHLLGPQLGAFVLPASFTVEDDRPWGSHWRIDHRWSSGQLAVAHFGEQRSRFDKLAHLVAIGAPLDRLHVCYRVAGVEGNCSRCPKCLTTMVVLSSLGALDGCGAFAPELPDPPTVEEMAEWPFRRTLDAALRHRGLPAAWEQALAAHLAAAEPARPRSAARAVADGLGRP